MASHTRSNQVKNIVYPKLTTIDRVGGILCHICHFKFGNKKDFDLHYTDHNTENKGVIYTCVVCFKEILGYPAFRGHCYTNHVIKRRFRCQYCDKEFSKQHSLTEHLNAMHKFNCSDCKNEFTSKRELQLHQVIHNTSDMPPFNCRFCDTQIDTTEECKEHAEMHCTFVYSCPICNENIISIDKANDHLSNHFEDVCEESPENSVLQEENIVDQLTGILCKCDLEFNSRVEYQEHFSQVHQDDDITYTCNVCGKEFEKYTVFREHSYNHFAKDRFSCHKCLKSFDRLSRLVTHASMCQGKAEDKPFFCMHCDRKYATEQRWRDHMRDIHGVHCVTCPEEGCDKVFSTSHSLAIHLQAVHSQKICCQQCGIMFDDIKSCKLHLEVHKKMQYDCPVCNRNYNDRNNIFIHIAQHFQSVLHMCKVCGKVFNAKNRLIYHVKLHDKVLTCKYCGKGFGKPGGLQAHLNTHTGDRPFKCPACSKDFSNNANFQKHIRRVHNIDGRQCKNNNKSDTKQNNPVSAVEETNLPKTQLQVNITDVSDVFETIIEPYYTTMESDIDQIVKEKAATLFHNTPFEKEDDGALFQNTPFEKEDEAALFQNTPFEKEKNAAIFQNTPFVKEDDAALFQNTSFEKEKDAAIFQNTPLDIEKNAALFQNATLEKSMFQIGLPTVSNDLCGETTQGSPQLNYPAEYGPEFNTSIHTDGTTFLDLDDHMLPHIDPLLTIKNDYNTNFESIEPIPYNDEKWEVVLKEYSFGYGDLVEGNRLPINTDIF